MAESSSNGLKTLWEKEKLLVTSNFSFSLSVFKRLVLQTCKNQGLFGKGFNCYLQILWIWYRSKILSFGEELKISQCAKSLQLSWYWKDVQILMLLFFYFSDGLVKKLNELERTATMYKGMIEHTKKLLKGTFELSQSHKGKEILNFIEEFRYIYVQSNLLLAHLSTECSVSYCDHFLSVRVCPSVRPQFAC